MTYTQTTPLSIEEWTSRAAKHEALVAPYADAFLKRRELRVTHPVHDFLFTYYTCSPQKLKQWVPSFEDQLMITPEVHEAYPWFGDYWFHVERNVLSLNRTKIHENIRGLAEFVAKLCGNILKRPPRLGCYGLHEWAMVYKSSADSIRYKGHRLRLSPEYLARFVESQVLCCSHYDAYRFFTEEARPLNVLNPTLDSRLEMEQSGCLHANMDLYKWATKLWPWVGSDFIAKAFFLALDCRELDMRASPYDLAEEGFAPVCIETEEGRKQYQKEQMSLMERSIPLRRELQGICERLLTV